MKFVVAVFLASIAIASGTAAAQGSDGYSSGPGLGTDRGGDPDPGAPSPEYTQDRNFGATRFWKLDQGHQEAEIWWRFRDPRHVDSYNIVQLEYEVGLTDRVQLDLYENLTDQGGHWTREGTQIEARIAIDPVYGRTRGNPVVYLEWHPLHLGPARAETRLLLGDSLAGNGKLFVAANLFYEQNVTRSSDGAGGTVWIPNPEAGFTTAVSYEVADHQRLRLGAEVKFALEKERFDDPAWERQLLIGPNLSTRIAGERLKLLSTVLVGVTDDAKKIDAYVIVATGF
jgi:hypothetical protein